VRFAAIFALTFSQNNRFSNQSRRAILLLTMLTVQTTMMDRTSHLLRSLSILSLLLASTAPLASCLQIRSKGAHITTRKETHTLPFRPVSSGSRSLKGSPSDQDESSAPVAVNSSPPTHHSFTEMAISTVGSTTSAVVSVVFFSVLAWKRDAFMVSFFLGSISNGILSKVLKKLVNQSRPEALQSAKMKLKPSDGGMPSSHAMSLGFIATFTTISLLSVIGTTTGWAPFGLLWMYVAVSLAYRVQVNLHTWQQVAAGLTVGSANGWMWHTACHDGVMDWVSSYLLSANGVLPLPLLTLPALFGVIVVGSFERRISAFLKSSSNKE
jgi:membrane-associated phospholipid phosphatase